MRTAILLLAGLLSACSTSVGTLALTSARPMPIPYNVIGPRGSGESCAWTVLGLGGAPSIEAALRDAFEKVPDGGMLVNVTLTSRWLITGIANQTCVEARGQIVPLPKGS
jgi:hypothetical protein